MSEMKRFWDKAAVAQAEGGFSVLLDGQPLRIPGRYGGAPLVVPGRVLAEAIEREWQAAGGSKGGTLDMDAVPLTRLAGTAQDRIRPDPGPVAEALAKYAETDLLCYRAAHPEPLVVRQAETWQPWLDWLERTHGARLTPIEGVMFRPQAPEALAVLRERIARFSPDVLAALGIAIPSLGSAVLGVALAEGAIGAPEAHAVATLDERFEAEQWGEDDEARTRLEQAAADVALADRYIRLYEAG